ncbi:VacJ family lipoprotein [Cognatishimia sp. F0-27]|nr:VacJ family lipoprotein [Cognatishimia sp. F0-27]
MVALCLVTLGLAACSVPGPGDAPQGIHDPYEAENRRVHAFNRAIDERLFRGDGPGLTERLPEGVTVSVLNVADTLSLPQTVVNQVLQGRLGRATTNSLRFGVNATLGFGGLADVASGLGMPRDETDFGETLYVWGAPEGAYLELPVLGPSTEREAAGRVVDLFTDPLGYVLQTRPRMAATVIQAGASAIDRGQFSDTIESVLYESTDSYDQLRLIYLQKRRFDLGDTTTGAVEEDPLALDTEGF